VKKKKIFTIIPLYLISLAFLLLPVSGAPAANVADIKLITDSLKINESSQVLLVTNNSPPSFIVNIHALEKKDGKWKKVRESIDGVIGKNGFAKPGEKREGDGKTPSGIFPLKMAFGYNESIRTKMPYRQALRDDLWIDDINAVDYNRWIKKENTQAVSYEKMKRDDNLYKYGIVIGYNTDPVIKGYGSAIFFHVWRGGNMATAGCVAVAEENIVKILGWLDPQALPQIIMGTENIIERLIQ
jgi:L,D-peptidoglycan transpeptidase YkuD (ErfK/YbiS/YcfS/YnhG family)